MVVFGTLLAVAGLIGIIVFLILGVIALIKKSGKAKMRFIFMTGSFVVLIIGFIIVPATSGSDTITTTQEPVKEEKVEKKETPEEKAKREAEEKAAAEEKAKKEAEQKKKEEAEAKAEAERLAKEEEAARVAAEKEEAEKKANAPTIPYAQLKKNPTSHEGEFVKYTGQIVQILEEDNYTNIRLAVTKESYGYNPGDIIFIEYDGTTEYVDEDVITVYGEMTGEHSYQSQAGWDISIPSMLADSFEE